MEDRRPDEGSQPEARRVRHHPVLLSEVLSALAPRDGEFYIDGTFGAGGYSSAILSAAACRVLALDRDVRAVRDSAPICEKFPNRLTVVEAPFGRMDDIARAQEGLPAGHRDPFVDAVVLDIGVSSMQIDEPERGFSFQTDGPLYMRMSATGPTAADVANTTDEATLADILFQLGDEKRSRAIARAIVRQREDAPLATTRDLASLVSRIFGGKKIDGRHPATRTFQALRIYVNDELGQLAEGLAAAERILKPGGRLVVVTFHSLEDRIAKRFLQSRSGKNVQGSRHLPPNVAHATEPSFRIFNQRPLIPQKPELDRNPRARSARLRAAIRTNAPPIKVDLDDLGVPRP